MSSEYIPLDFSDFRAPQEGLVFEVQGRFTRDGGVEVTEIHQDESYLIPYAPSEVDVILLNASGHELARAPLRRGMSHAVRPMPPDWQPGQGVGCIWWESEYFKAIVTAVTGGVSLVIKRGENLLWTQHAPGPRPVLGQIVCEIDGEIGIVKWADESASTLPYEVRVQFARDKTAFWESLPTSGAQLSTLIDNKALRSGTRTFAIRDIPPGEPLVHVAMSDGFYTDFSNPVHVVVPERPPEIEITKPEISDYPQNWGKLTFRASARTSCSAAGGIYDDKLYRWLLDDVAATEGSRLDVDGLSIGWHSATVLLTYNGKQTSKSIRFEITASLLANMAAAQAQIPAMQKQFPEWDWTDERSRK